MQSLYIYMDFQSMCLVDQAKVVKRFVMVSIVRFIIIIFRRERIAYVHK